jgi:putative nucleotidyltransferase with HDIG domain
MKINNKDIQVEVENIQIGMFVSELDIPWDGSGFLLQGFLVTEHNIEHLKKKCQWVMVSKKRSQSDVVFLNQHLDANHAEDLTKVSDLRLTSPLRSAAKLTRKESFFDRLLQSFSGLLGESKPNKLAFASTVYASKDSLGFKSKQDLILAKKASKVRSKFQDDALASKELKQHYATASVKEEKAAASTSKKNLISTVEKALSFDVENSATMNIVLNETRESVGSIVESMIRNPEAMSLVDNIRRYDNYSYKHAVDVCVLMIAFGRELHLPKDDLIELGIGGLLHDIGEVSPKQGKQSSSVKNIAMFGIYKNHVEDGLEMLKKSPYSEIVKTIIAEHHEHYDGTGYPNQLCCIDKNPRKYVNIVKKITKPISMYGRMIAIVDNYVSLTSGRSNVSPVVPSDAMSYILQKAGTHFDPALCDVFSQVIGVYPVGAYVELSTNEIALVLQQNRAWRLSPVLKVLTDTNRKKVQPYLLDLMNQKSHMHRAIKKDIAFKA